MKKMFRRGIAAALAIMLVAMSGISGFATIAINKFDAKANVDKAEFPGWIVKTSDATFGAGAVAEIREGGYDGGNALYLNSVNPDTTGGKIYAYCDSIGMLYGGTYEISFKFKFEDYANDTTENKFGENKVDVKTGANNPSGFTVIFGTNAENTMSGWANTNFKVHIEDLGDGWYSAKYHRQTLATTGGTPMKASDKYRYLKICLNQDNGGAGVYVDDVNVARVDAGGNAINENIVYNGDFEITEKTGTDKDSYEISNVVVGEADTALTLSWNNASSSRLQSVELYDITDEENPVKVNANISSVPGEKVRYSISGLATDINKYYKVISKFNNGTITETILAGHTGQQAQVLNTSVNSWKYVPEETATDESMRRLVSVELDERVKFSGDASMRIKTGYTATEESAESPYGVSVQTIKIARPFYKEDGTSGGTPLVPTADIRYGVVSMWVKTEDVGYYTIEFGGKTVGKKGTIPTGTSAGDENNEIFGIKGGDVRSNDWTYFEALIPAAKDGGSYAFRVQAKGARMGSLWIDDIEFYPCDANGVILAGATNLLTNEGHDAGFEASSDALDKVLKDAPKNVEATAGNGYVTVSWAEELNSPDTNGETKEHKKIYFVTDDGKYIYKGKAYQGCTSMTFENLENDVTYKIAVVNCGLFGGESPEAVVTATTVAPAFEMGEYELYNGSTKLSILEPGTLTAKINIVNNKVSEGIKATLIAAVYSAQNVLKHVYYDCGDDDGSVAVGDDETLTVNNIVVEEGDLLKTFLWDDLDSIKVIKPAKSW